MTQPQGNEFPIVPRPPKPKRNLLHQLFELILRQPAPRCPVIPEKTRDEPMIIDAEFEIHVEEEQNPTQPLYPFMWDMTPDEYRQIRKWKGYDD